MLFCHLADCQSLRDITLGVKGISKELNHLVLVKAPSRNALSWQNKHRDAGVAREIYMRTREKLMGLQHYDCRFRSGIKAARVLLLDSSMVTLCEKVFDWAGYSAEKEATKLHTLFSFNDFLPVDIFVSDGKEPDNNGTWHVMPSRRSIVVTDRGYDDTALWRAWAAGGHLRRPPAARHQIRAHRGAGAAGGPRPGNPCGRNHPTGRGRHGTAVPAPLRRVVVYRPYDFSRRKAGEKDGGGTPIRLRVPVVQAQSRPSVAVVHVSQWFLFCHARR